MKPFFIRKTLWALVKLRLGRGTGLPEAVFRSAGDHLLRGSGLSLSDAAVVAVAFVSACQTHVPLFNNIMKVGGAVRRPQSWRCVGRSGDCSHGGVWGGCPPRCSLPKHTQWAWVGGSGGKGVTSVCAWKGRSLCVQD